MAYCIAVIGGTDRRARDSVIGLFLPEVGAGESAADEEHA
jgi:hypothetical protein